MVASPYRRWQMATAIMGILLEANHKAEEYCSWNDSGRNERIFRKRLKLKVNI